MDYFELFVEVMSNIFYVFTLYISLLLIECCFFFFKQKTAYEMRISDWSSDVCSSDLLDAHFMAGDGRVNENIGLTAVHHVFHAEHNRLVEHTKEVVLASGDLAFLNEWLVDDVAALPATPAAIDALVGDGERLFQAAKESEARRGGNRGGSRCRT